MERQEREKQARYRKPKTLPFTKLPLSTTLPCLALTKLSQPHRQIYKPIYDNTSCCPLLGGVGHAPANTLVSCFSCLLKARYSVSLTVFLVPFRKATSALLAYAEYVIFCTAPACRW